MPLLSHYRSAMAPRDKYLYHQTHPARLLTDWITGLIALYFFWRHEIPAATAIALSYWQSLPPGS
jgi:hypothetical protein